MAGVRRASGGSDFNHGSLSAQFSPQILCKISEHFLTIPPNSEITAFGLLFGAAGKSDVVIQSFRLTPMNWPQEKSSTASCWSRALPDWGNSDSDPELTWLDPVGWFCTRPDDSRGLLASDMEFHNLYFPDPSNLAVIFHSEPQHRISAELYASCLNSPMAAEHFRAGSLFVSPQISPREPLKVTIRERISEDSYLRTYEVFDTVDREEILAGWNNRARSIFRLKRAGAKSAARRRED